MCAEATSSIRHDRSLDDPCGGGMGLGGVADDAPELAAVDAEVAGYRALAAACAVPGLYRLLHRWRASQCGWYTVLHYRSARCVGQPVGLRRAAPLWRRDALRRNPAQCAGALLCRVRTGRTASRLAGHRPDAEAHPRVGDPPEELHWRHPAS